MEKPEKLHAFVLDPQRPEWLPPVFADPVPPTVQPSDYSVGDEVTVLFAGREIRGIVTQVSDRSVTLRERIERPDLPQ